MDKTDSEVVVASIELAQPGLSPPAPLARPMAASKPIRRGLRRWSDGREARLAR